VPDTTWRPKSSPAGLLGLGAAAVLLVGVFAVGAALRDRDHSSESGSAVVTASDEARTQLVPADTGAGAESATPLPDRNAQTESQDASGGAATATTFAGTTAATTAAASETTAAGAPTGGASTNQQPAAGPVSLTSTDDLRRYVADQRQAGLRDVGERCDGRFGTAIGDVSWRGAPAIVVVEPDTAAPTRALVVDGGCVVVASIDLP